MTDKEKLNQVYTKLLTDIKELCFRSLSYSERHKLNVLLDHLSGTNKAYQVLVKELEDKLAPELPPVPVENKPEWNN